MLLFLFKIIRLMILQKFSKYFLILAGSLGVSGVLYQNISAAIDNYQFPPPGKMVDVGGYRLHIQGSGSATPTVILDAGLAMNSMDWALVQPEIARFARVYSYDRPGLGWSELSPYPRDSLTMAKELHALLHAFHLEPPFILVGHSSGGANVLMYAFLYPDEVSGLVLVDSVHEKQSELLPPDEPIPWNERLTCFSDPYLGRLTGTFGISRFFLKYSQLQKDLDQLPPSIKKPYFAKLSSPEFFRTAYAEDVHFDESLKQLARMKKAVHIPIIVITAGPQINEDDPTIDPADKTWSRFQQEICDLSDKSIHLFAENSDHMIPWHQPEIIVEAVKLLSQP